MQDAISPDAVRRSIDAILARPEFGREETLLQRLFAWLQDFFRLEGVELSFAAETIRLVVGLLLIAAFALLSVQLARASARARLEPGGEAEAPRFDPRLRAARLRHAAAAARDAGDLRLALRRQFCALLVGLGARGDLRYRDAWTNRELLRRGRPSDAARALLEPLVRTLESKDFGRTETTAGDVARLEALCEEHLGPLSALPPARDGFGEEAA